MAGSRDVCNCRVTNQYHSEKSRYLQKLTLADKKYIAVKKMIIIIVCFATLIFAYLQVWLYWSITNSEWWLTCLTKIIVNGSFTIHTWPGQYCAVRKQEIIGSISIKVTHQTWYVSFVFLTNYSFTSQKSNTETNF